MRAASCPCPEGPPEGSRAESSHRGTGIDQEVLDFLQLFYRLVFASHVVETNIRALLDGLFRFRFAERHLRVIGLVHLNEEENHKAHKQKHGKQAQESIHESVRQLDLILDVGMSRQELHKGVLTDICGSVLTLRSQRLFAEFGGLHLGRPGAKKAFGLGIERLDGGVVRIRRGRPRRSGRVIRSGNRVITRIVNHVLHAVLLHGLNELRRDERVGFLRVHEIHHLAADEKRHQEEQQGRDDANSLRGFGHELLGILRIEAERGLSLFAALRGKGRLGLCGLLSGIGRLPLIKAGCCRLRGRNLRGTTLRSVGRLVSGRLLGCARRMVGRGLGFVFLGSFAHYFP